MSALCIVCKVIVTGRKHAVSCDACERWQHRLCGTGKVAFFFHLMILIYLPDLSRVFGILKRTQYNCKKNILKYANNVTYY